MAKQMVLGMTHARHTQNHLFCHFHVQVVAACVHVHAYAHSMEFDAHFRQKKNDSQRKSE
jgi:hypothetical protein